MTNRFPTLVIAAILIIGLVGCTRPISSTPIPFPTATPAPAPAMIPTPTPEPVTGDYLIAFDLTPFDGLEPEIKIEKLKEILDQKFKEEFFLNFQYSQEDNAVNYLVALRQDISSSRRDRIVKTLIFFTSHLISPSQNIIYIVFPDGNITAFPAPNPSLHPPPLWDPVKLNNEIQNNPKFVDFLSNSPAVGVFLSVDSLTSFWLDNYTPSLIDVEISTDSAKLFFMIFAENSQKAKERAEDILYTVFTAVANRADAEETKVVIIFPDGKIRIFSSEDNRQIRENPQNWREYIKIERGAIKINFPK